jgi:hypothetical protein
MDIVNKSFQKNISKDLKYFAKFDNLIKNAKKQDKCKNKHCKDLIQVVENERKENAKYIMDYYAKSKAHKDFLKKQNEYKKITDMKEQIRLSKLNLKEYHNTKEYKEFNRKTNDFINKKLLDQCGFNNCKDLYIEELNIRLKTFTKDKIKIPKDLTYNDYIKKLKK